MFSPWNSLLCVLASASIALAYVVPSQNYSLDARAASDFSFDTSGKGSCSGEQQSAIEAWFDDVVNKMIPAATAALDEYKEKGARRTGMTLYATLGIAYNWETERPQDAEEVDVVKSWFEAAARYLGGAFDDFGYSAGGWIVCHDDWMEKKAIGDYAYNKEGLAMKTGDEHLRIWEVEEYREWVNAAMIPMWLTPWNEYMFVRSDSVEANGGLCSSGNAAHIHQHFRSILIFCASQNNDNNNNNVFSQRTRLLDTASIKSGDSLGKLTSAGFVLLHEAMHASRGNDNTLDNDIYGPYKCWEKIRTNEPELAQMAPDCAAFFALAMYYQRASAGKENWVFTRLEAQKNPDA